VDIKVCKSQLSVYREGKKNSLTSVGHKKSMKIHNGKKGSHGGSKDKKVRGEKKRSTAEKPKEKKETWNGGQGVQVEKGGVGALGGGGKGGGGERSGMSGGAQGGSGNIVHAAVRVGRKSLEGENGRTRKTENTRFSDTTHRKSGRGKFGKYLTCKKRAAEK